MDFKSPEELILYFKSNDRIKFTVKLFYVLQFVEKYPEYQNDCGTSWCSDGRNFISNPIILGKTLSIKPNTINANFRSHGFAIIPVKFEELSAEFPNLSDVKNWKKRINHQYNFCSTSFIDEVKQIPCRPFPSLKSLEKSFFISNTPCANYVAIPLKIVSKPPINEHKDTKNDDVNQEIKNNILNNINNQISFQMPPETQSLLSNDNNTYFDTGILMNKISNNIEMSCFLTLSATKDWIQIVGNVSKADPNQVVEAIAANYQTLPQYTQLKANILYLLLSHSKLTHQPDKSLSFDQFLNFFLRYGCISKAASYINDLTVFSNNSSAFSLYSSSSSENSQDSNYLDSQPASLFASKFQTWFQPSFNAATSIKILENQPLKTWLLRPSSKPGRFTLHYKSSKKCVSATYIEFNPMNALNEPPLKVMVENEGFSGALNWNSMLFDVMKLNLENSFSLESLNNQSNNSMWNDKLIDQPPQIFLSSSQVELNNNSQLLY